MPLFPGNSQAIQDALQGACCYDLCEPLVEPEDNQFLAAVLWSMIVNTGVQLSDITNAQVQDASRDVWCELNMATLCSVPNAKLKALILAYLQSQT